MLFGRQYTWANRRDNPTFEKLDRVLASVEWKNKFPMVSVRALTRIRSDHTPLFLDSGEQAHLGNKTHFSFELSWIRQDGFYDLVQREWNVAGSNVNAMENWQSKIRHLRSYLRGWAKNHSSIYKTKKARLINIIDTLDTKAKISPLDNDERRILRNANDELAKLRRDEETKWAQRAQVKHIQQGGNNTKYFHLIANGKHRRKNFFQLEQEEGTIDGQDNLKTYISFF
jgi:hypothetical protein